MNRNARKNRIGRVLAAGLGLALAGGMSLVAVAPAQAAEYVTNIDPSTIGANGEVNADWYVSNGTFSATSEGLALHGLSAVGQSFGFNQLMIEDFVPLVESGALSVTTGLDSAPAHLQIIVDARSAESDNAPRPVTLTQVSSDPVTLDSMWTTDASISSFDGSFDGELPPEEFAAGHQTTLGEFLNADGMYGVSGFGLAGSVAGQDSVVTAASWPVVDSQYIIVVNNYTFLTPLPAGTVTVTGNAAIGETLTATTSGWPEGVEFSYQWGSGQLYNGGPIEGATAATYKITSAEAQRFISVFVTATMDGYAATSVGSERTALVPALEKETAPAPVAESADIAAYLADNGVQLQEQATVGLPEGKLDAGTDHTATLAWIGDDSFVDVYLYSTPTKVGTFPVINGEAQITLSAEVLSTLEGESHTLVVTGQSSGAVQAIALAVEPAAVVEPVLDVQPAASDTDSLADTGSAVTAPLAAAALLLLGGAALTIVRRRMAHQA